MKRSILVTFLLSAFCVAQFVPAVHAQETPAAKQAKPQKTKGKSQTELAAKGAFPVINAADPKVKSALSATNLAGAKKLIGKPSNVVGTVTKVYMPKSNKIVLLNFAKDYKTALVGVVEAKDFAKFPALKDLKGKKVLLSGKIINFKGAPEVQLDKTGAISLVK